MTSRTTTAALAAGLLVIALAGCASPSTDASSPPAVSPSEEAPSSSSEEPTTSAMLMVADSDLGEIVVDGDGMTVYMFDNDTQGAGASVCEGDCATNWPAVTTESEAPEVEGVTGEVGTIEGVDGATQVTLNGWPLYYFAGDSAAGDVAGQGVGGVWWVLSPAGERMAE
ncbi:putative lipoprotein with Yx(FWY)xxD motif [Agrococcus sp. UYP10]|uniref:COG4315 family predicted lipoprotein n=1 Tax=Agrococcus sp. UYP10 TaxID=1756355 RepID=UPI003398CFC2